MGLLVRHRDVSFLLMRDALGLTDGNLATHARRLEESGFLAARRALARDRFEVRYRITEAGAAAFREYLAWLRSFLEDSGDGSRAPPESVASGPSGASSGGPDPSAPGGSAAGK
jgi:DNA-binding MarR family transcriptional regulator